MDKSKKPPSAGDYAIEEMALSNSNDFYLVKPPPPIKEEERKQRERELFTYPRIVFSNYAKSIFNGDAPGTEKVDYLFFPGCQLSAVNPGYVEKAYKYLLTRIKEGVGLMLGCCGAPADWTGREVMMEENIENIQNVWNETGKPVFILACSNCTGIFERYMPKIPYVTLWEIFTRYGLPDLSGANSEQGLTISNACMTRNNKEVNDSVKKIISGLGYGISQPKEAEGKSECCGYDGMVLYPLQEQIRDCTPNDESHENMLVYCTMCRDWYAGGGNRTFHILDLIFGQGLVKVQPNEMPNLTERQKSRVDLKTRLLRELWGEEPE
jgi:hypothetical protein